jgi:hypothetical protein
MKYELVVRFAARHVEHGTGILLASILGQFA